MKKRFVILNASLELRFICESERSDISHQSTSFFSSSVIVFTTEVSAVKYIEDVLLKDINFCNSAFIVQPVFFA